MRVVGPFELLEPVDDDHAHSGGLDQAGLSTATVFTVDERRSASTARSQGPRAPGERRWRPAGHLPEPLADEGAVSFAGGIVVVGGRDASSKLATVTLLRRG
jgi:hypothetical protein